MDHFRLTFDFAFDWRRFFEERCPYSSKVLGFWLELVSKREQHFKRKGGLTRRLPRLVTALLITPLGPSAAVPLLEL
jgi:hypothetical protein